MTKKELKAILDHAKYFDEKAKECDEIGLHIRAEQYLLKASACKECAEIVVKLNKEEG